VGLWRDIQAFNCRLKDRKLPTLDYSRMCYDDTAIEENGKKSLNYCWEVVATIFIRLREHRHAITGTKRHNRTRLQTHTPELEGSRSARSFPLCGTVIRVYNILDLSSKFWISKVFSAYFSAWHQAINGQLSGHKLEHISAFAGFLQVQLHSTHNRLVYLESMSAFQRHYCRKLSVW